jgi:hypothetical protein
MVKMKEALGVDVGGVVIARVRSLSDTSFSSQNFLMTPPMAGTFEVLKQLGVRRFGEDIF